MWINFYRPTGEAHRDWSTPTRARFFPLRWQSDPDRCGNGGPYGSQRACLVLAQDKLYAIHRGEKIALPSGSPEDYLRYLKAAMALDPPPSPLEPVVQELTKGLALPPK